jgi:predicted RNase H-like HicB family nuclease
MRRPQTAEQIGPGNSRCAFPFPGFGGLHTFLRVVHIGPRRLCLTSVVRRRQAVAGERSALDSTRPLRGSYYLGIDMRIEIEQEEDGRWLTEIPELPGVMVYGASREEAVARVKALALRVLADRLEHGETVPELVEVFSVAA